MVVPPVMSTCHTYVTWFAREVNCAMDFFVDFVDEDPSRQGQHFMGRRVPSPNQVPTVPWLA